MADYDMLSAFASGAKGFIQGSENAEDRRYKRLEQEARTRAHEEERKRQAFRDALDLRSKGFQVPEGNIYDMDASKLQYDPQYLDLAREKASLAAGADPYGLKAMQAAKAREEMEASKKAKTPSGRVEKLAGDQRKRFDDTTGALDALGDLDLAYGSKGRKSFEDATDMIDVPLRGGTPYTIARDQFVESLGRLQSGGAITGDEVNNFKKLIPGAFDKPEIARKKLEDLKFRLGSRLKSFGLSPEEAVQGGFLKESTAKGLMSKGLVDPAAAPKAAPKTPEDVQALEWAKKNKNDPRAKEILRLNGL
jgi:hypothetical protein